MKVRFEYGTFGPAGSWKDLEGRLMLGAVEFTFFKVSDSSVRQARGTRDLSYPEVGWDLLPMNIKTPPDHVLCYIDLSKGPAWRCFIKNLLLWYSDEVEIPDEII